MVGRMARRVRWLLPVLAGVATLGSALLLPVPAGAAPAGPAGECWLEDAGARIFGPDSCRLFDARPRAVQIEDAKTAAANAYDAFLRGRGSAEALAIAQWKVAALTGEQIPAPVRYQAPTTNARGATAVAPAPLSRIQTQFEMFRQVNGSYCGPATAASILLYLGDRESATLDEVRNERPVIIGDPERDQGILANPFWLATDKYGGTNWGDFFMEFTLNSWRGTDWYVQSGTSKVDGKLTREQAWRNIQYSIDHGYPVAVNVQYGPNTYTPAGFNPEVRYLHWDVISGYYTGADGKRYVRLSTTYSDPDREYQPTQEIAWDEYWPTIGKWHDMVW